MRGKEASCVNLHVCVLFYWFCSFVSSADGTCNPVSGTKHDVRFFGVWVGGLDATHNSPGLCWKSKKISHFRHVTAALHANECATVGGAAIKGGDWPAASTCIDETKHRTENEMQGPSGSRGAAPRQPSRVTRWLQLKPRGHQHFRADHASIRLHPPPAVPVGGD
jgi:hypothetical protein